MKAITHFKKAPVLLTVLGAAVTLSFAGCDRHDSGGTANDSLERAGEAVQDAADDVRDATRDAARTNRLNSRTERSLDRAADRLDDAARDAQHDLNRNTKDAANEIGRGLDKAGEDLQKAADGK